ncbi:MAG: DUF433 domain-containing protein [Sediminibacterium sp.]
MDNSLSSLCQDDQISAGWTENQILESYPTVTAESLRAVFLYLKESLIDPRNHLLL